LIIQYFYNIYIRILTYTIYFSNFRIHNTYLFYSYNNLKRLYKTLEKCNQHTSAMFFYASHESIHTA